MLKTYSGSCHCEASNVATATQNDFRMLAGEKEPYRLNTKKKDVRRQSAASMALSVARSARKVLAPTATKAA